MKKSRARKPLRPRRSPVSAHRPTISLCVIARDEAAFIGDCLASARPFVDEIIVLDTGSSDTTSDIARTYGARIASFEWADDFAAARNAAIDLTTCDWILMLDADERLQAASGPMLRAFLESAPNGTMCYAPRVENLDGEGPRTFQISFPNRIFKRQAGPRYVGAIHEDLAYPADRARLRVMRLEFVRVTHLGYLPDVIEARDKFARNRRLLLREAAARPDDPLPWYYLGMDQVAANRPAEAAEYLRRSLACSDNRPNWSRVDVYTNLIVSYIRLNDLERLQPTVEEAERAGALSASARTSLALNFSERGLYLDAERQLLMALESGQPIDQVGKAGVGGWSTRTELAQLYERMGRAPAALSQIELALADPELHQRGDLASTAVRLAIEVGDMASLARSLDAVPAPHDADLAGHLRLLELRALAGPASCSVGVYGSIDRAIGLADWQSAYDAARTLNGGTMAEAARLLFVALRLQNEGAPQAALNLLVRLHDAQPELPQVHALLTSVLADLGRYDDALASNEILRKLQVVR